MSVFPSTFFIDEIQDLIIDDTPFLALYTEDPTAAGTGDEVTGGSYAREAITFDQTGAVLSNDAEIRFTMPTATVTHFGVLNASTAGDLKVYGAITSSIAVILGDELVFPIGSITINLAGS